MANNQLLASDNFASGSLNPAWVTFAGNSLATIISGPPNYAECPSTSVGGYQIWTGKTWPNDQVSEAMFTLTAESNSYGLLFLRWQPGTYSGYQVTISNNTLRVDSYNASTPTQIGSTVTGLTFAANDIWTASIDGGIISVYQNFKRVFWGADATLKWTSGYPGFGVYSGTNITHSKCYSWRGYSAVQQDGVWSKQGTVIRPLTTSYPTGPLINSRVIYEGNAQVLSGTVYKTLFYDSNTGASQDSIYYAESTDGEHWTRYATPVLAGYITPAFIKNGSTYYMYAQPYTSAGTGDFALFTSTDMINWTLISSTVIGLGSASAWDSTRIWSFIPIAIINGTWYAVYGAGLSGATYYFSMGLATSSDGQTWTKYASNPVLIGAYPTSAFAQVGSTWYGWVQTTQLGRGAPINPTLDPSECTRYQTTDFIHWTNPVHSVHMTELLEGVNTNIGQSYINSLIDIGGKAYAYLSSVASDETAPNLGGITLAIAPAPIAGLITQPESGLQQTQTDPFTSGSGNLDANWTTPTGGTALKIVAGPYVEPTATSALCQAVYTGASFNQNQYSQIVLQTLTGTLFQSYVCPMVLASTTALTDYEAEIGSPTATSDAAAKIIKRVAGTPTQIGPTATCEPQVGDVWTLSVVFGSDGFPVLSLFQNGFLILQVQDQSSTPITTGNPGIAAYSSVAIADAQIASWAGGNANVIPGYNKGWGWPFLEGWDW